MLGWRGTRWTSGPFPTRDLAERVLKQILADVAAGRAGLAPDPLGFPTLAEAARAWLDRRKVTHRAADDDESRWNRHLAPFFGSLRPADVDAARLRAFVEAKLAEGLSPSTVRLCVMLLSSLFADLVEQGIATANPVRALPRSTRRLIRPSHDPRTTPFIEKLDDVRRVLLDLDEPVNVAYALGALAGLRTGEVLGLRWEHVDLAGRRIHVRESARGPLKDKDSRVVVMLDALLDVLTPWKLMTGGQGRVVPAMRSDGAGLDEHTLGKYLRATLARLRLPRLTWYQATRHTFASHWVLNGGAIETLREMMGHCSVLVTERYAHLRPDLFGARDLGRIPLDVRPGSPEAAQIGHRLATASGENGVSA